MNRILTISIAVFLVACGDSYMKPEVYYKAKEICVPHGGLQSVRVTVEGRYDTEFEGYCSNSLYFKKWLKE